MNEVAVVGWLGWRDSGFGFPSFTYNNSNAKQRWRNTTLQACKNTVKPFGVI